MQNQINNTMKIHTVPDLLSICRLYSEKPAIISGNEIISYDKFLNMVNEFSEFLIQKGLQKGNRVGIITSDRLAFLVGVYGTINAGGISVPLSSGISPKGISYILEDSETEILIIDNSHFNSQMITPTIHEKTKLFIDLDIDDSSQNFNHKKLVSFKPKYKSDINDFKSSKISIDDPALMLYTSGTTGKKKGVLLSHQNLMKTAKYMNEFMKIDGIIREFIAVPITHAFGFGRTRSILLAGGSMVIENGKLTSEKILDSIKNNNCNALSSVSAVFANLIKNHEKIFSTIGTKIKWIEIGSMPLKLEYKKKLLEIFPDARIHMNYGMTEAMRSTLINFRDEYEKISTVGKPSPGVKIQIFDYQDNVLSHDEIGVIAVKGVNLALGYWKKNKEWNEKNVNDWFKTDDIGYLDKDGYLTFLGRKDDKINVGGHKFYPAEIEAILASHFTDSSFCICGGPDPNGILGEIPVLCVEIDNINLNEIQNSLEDKVEHFMIPKKIVKFDAIPKTDNGKIRRGEIKEKIWKEITK